MHRITQIHRPLILRAQIVVAEYIQIRIQRLRGMQFAGRVEFVSTNANRLVAGLAPVGCVCRARMGG